MVVLSIVIIASLTATHERTRIHVDRGLFCHIICTRTGYRIFGCPRMVKSLEYKKKNSVPNVVYTIQNLNKVHNYL
jgi:hypothetical protein